MVAMGDPSGAAFAVGRFASWEPLGFEAGDNNWYRFVSNGPTTAVDSRGLEKELPEGNKGNDYAGIGSWSLEEWWENYGQKRYPWPDSYKVHCERGCIGLACLEAGFGSPHGPPYNGPAEQTGPQHARGARGVPGPADRARLEWRRLGTAEFVLVAVQFGLGGPRPLGQSPHFVPGGIVCSKAEPTQVYPPSVPIDQVGDYNYATWHELPENHGYWRYMNNGIGNQDRPTVIHAGSLPKAEVTYFFVVPRIKIEPPTIEPTRSESR